VFYGRIEKNAISKLFISKHQFYIYQLTKHNKLLLRLIYKLIMFVCLLCPAKVSK